MDDGKRKWREGCDERFGGGIPHFQGKSDSLGRTQCAHDEFDSLQGGRDSELQPL